VLIDILTIDSIALFGSASEMFLRAEAMYVNDDGTLSSRQPTKRGLEDGFGLNVANITEGVDVNVLLAKVAIGKEGREWTVEDRIGRRNMVNPV
jgi:hypothetical protein